MLRIALLVCDSVPSFKDACGDYETVYRNFLESSLAEVDFVLDAYNVVDDMAYPPDDVHYDGLLVSGSRANAYDSVAWIDTLVAYVRRIIADKPALKVFGICFGHQIVALALGGTCAPNDGRWEVAVTTVELTPIGKAIFGADQIDVQQMHKDHVPLDPPVPNVHILGSTEVSPNHGMVLFEPSAPPPGSEIDPRSIQVLTIQGHPEFTPAIINTIIDARAAIFGDELTRDARTRAGGLAGRRDGLACDGVGRIGRVIWGVLGVTYGT